MNSFLTTQEWLDFQHAIGRQAWRYSDNGLTANIIRHDLPFRKNYLYVPHGPVIDFDRIQSGLKNAMTEFFRNLRMLARAHKSLFIKFEPMEDIVVELLFGQERMRHSTKQVQPNRTVVLDLSASELDMMGAMHQKTRYNINLASKKDLSLKESTNAHAFWDILRKTAEHDKFSTHTYGYYEKLLGFFEKDGPIRTKLYLVKSGDTPIAGAIMLTYGDTIYYLHGAMDREYRALMAPYFMHWEMINRAKGEGYAKYDFWGINARTWPGVTRFKLGFGGKVVEYPGAFDLPTRPIWYDIYNITRRIF